MRVVPNDVRQLVGKGPLGRTVTDPEASAPSRMGGAAAEARYIAADVVADDVGALVAAEIVEFVLLVAHGVSLSKAVLLVKDEELGPVDYDRAFAVDPGVALVEVDRVSRVEIPLDVRRRA